MRASTHKVSGMKLTRTQAAALLCFAGKTPRTLQTNHQINGVKACIKHGLISRRYEGMSVVDELTDAGKAMIEEIGAGRLLV